MIFVDSERRYELLRKLGEGGMGVVYEVRDVARKMRVALKTIRNVDAENIFRLKREFRALSELSHPNIINLYELVADPNVWFMTMELVEGVELLSHVRHGRRFDFKSQETGSTGDVEKKSSTTSITRLSAKLRQGSSQPSISAGIGLPTPPLAPTPVEQFVDLTRLRNVLTQLAEALYTLHRADMVHRDLKPSNVLVTDSGRVVLMDFGIVAELSRLSDADAGALGTPHYMAPEQAKGNPPQTSADWYAFGVILYEALTGRLPFRGGSLHVLQIKQHRQPLAPSLFASGIPAPLEELCSTLLCSDPDQRPGGHEVLKWLGVRRRRRRRHSTIPSGPAPLFVGRAQELQVLADKLRTVRAGGCQSVIVSGPSGIGKTTLLSHFLHNLFRPERRECLVLTGYCRERESLVYKAFDGVMEQLSRYISHRPEVEKAALIPNDIAFATHIFPALDSAVPESALAADEVDNATEKRTRGLAAIRHLVANITATTPLVLRIEDIQWADRDSLALLTELLQSSAQTRMMLLMTLRLDSVSDGVVGPNTATSYFLEQLNANTDHQHLHLAPLDLAEQRELVANAVEFTEFSTGARQLDSLLWNQPIGHPMLILELMRSASDIDTLGTPPSLESMLRMRVDSLGDPPARMLMDYIALAGNPLPLSIFARASGLSQSECERALAVLRVNLLVHNQRSTPHPWPVVYHDKIREAVVQRIPPDERKDMHSRLAWALADWPEAPPTVLADHWLAAGERQRAAWSRFCAARDAVEILALERAVELFHSVLALMPDPPVFREHAKLVCQTYIGMLGATRTIDSDRDDFEHLRRAHEIATKHNFLEELASIHFLWGSLLFTRGHLEACLEQHELSLGFAERTRSPYLQARALSGLGDAYYMDGRMQSAYDSFNRSIELAREFAFDRIIAGSLYMRGMALFYRNELRAGLRDSLDAVTAAQKSGHKRAEVVARTGCVAWIRYEMADFEQARAQLESGLQLARQIGARRFEPNSLSFLARILAITGDRRQACEYARESVAVCRATGMTFLGPMSLSALALGTDDPAERDQALEEGWSYLRSGGLSHNQLWFHRDAIDVFWAAELPDSMDRHADALHEYTRAEPVPWSRFHIARARALADHLRGRGDPGVLRRLLERAHSIGLHHPASALKQALDSYTIDP